jgi:hypothetical protein
MFVLNRLNEPYLFDSRRLKMKVWVECKNLRSKTMLIVKGSIIRLCRW